ncbi:NB-ARC domain-containing protein [Streptomyces solicathayae]|uniref:NB-ARC domain-containing protein n=1 Tax=Streptomyces solicathayae TaxID=3081768 RepID=A0ABZ0LWX0_9ACTN|nr:NB-ARC domain-containing protein [Streptomyces sp. HUAS YS2]WOX23912.1 NB-ARC domain-containing protein [Streptomyces sp. HUAS YS2]
MEGDLRSSILEACGPEDDGPTLLSAERYERAVGRLERESGAQSAPNLHALIPYLDFADAYEVLAGIKQRLPEDMQESLRGFAPMVGKLTQVRNRVAHTRPMEIDDLAAVHDVARACYAESPAHWSTLGKTLGKLEDNPAYVLGLTISLVADPDNAPQHNLPAPEFDETGFFGRRTELDRIKKAIKGAYPVVSILGDGGIGKTSIALKAAYELLDDPKNPFEALVWVTAKATILTVNEIQRISGAIETSLGLFASAAEQLGGSTARASADPVAEVLSYLEHFKVLLILDNMETVLDQRLREFLLDLPMGSKVIITSRIGLGIENPVALAPLSNEDSTKLLRKLARVRNVEALQGLQPPAIAHMVAAMKGHPAYIRWFVAGIQAGRRPEELLQENDLLLDFCMSNVYGHLAEQARAVLRSMQALPGRKSQAELAFLNDYSANDIQSSLLELITTNFVQMQGASMDQSSETTYQLTDFGKQYLDKRHALDALDRELFEGRSRRLADLGVKLQAESTASPYDPKTLDIKGPGDFSTARLLREALRSHERGESDAALVTCREAQKLSPGYHESWRVEAYVQAARRDHVAALAAYERAHELAPDSTTLKYLYGSFLVDEAVDVALGLKLLQQCAVAAEVPPLVVNQIAWAHLTLGDFDSALSSASHAVSLRPDRYEGTIAMAMGLRAAVYAMQKRTAILEYGTSVEIVEQAADLVDSGRIEMLTGEAADRVVQLVDMCEDLIRTLDEDFLLSNLESFAARLRDRLRSLDPELLNRRVGRVTNIPGDKLFGFARSWGRDYFFHLNDLLTDAEWPYLASGVWVAFYPDEENPRGARAASLRWLG